MDHQQRQGHARQLTDLATALHAERREAPTVKAIVWQALEVVPDAQHASLTVRTKRRGFTTLASTSDLATRADEWQYELGEGPCVDTATQGGWWRSGAVGEDPRWPRWGPHAHRTGVRSLLSVRLTRHDEPYGAINLYSGTDQRFDDVDQVDLALLWATHAADALATAQQLGGLETALASRHLIGMAQGIVMRQFDLTEDQSFSLLCRVSSTRNEKLRDVAQDIVRSGHLLVPGPASAPAPPRT